MPWPCSTSTCRSFMTMSSGFSRFPAISWSSNRRGKTTPVGGPLQWGHSNGTGSAWIATLSEAEVRISMDGRGRCMDNIFIDRLWRSLEQETVYLEELNDGFQAHRVICDWMTF